MNRALTIALAGGMLATLGGCQSILEPLGFARSDTPASGDISSEYAAAQDVYFQDRLDAGKEDLRNGNFAAAMQAFRQASLGRSTRAEALNGLGVAYAGIGRLDLAKRYFYQAASLDPQDSRFAANIARLHRELDRVDEQIELARVEEEMERVERNAMTASIGSQDLAARSQQVRVEGELPAMTAAATQPVQQLRGPVRVQTPPAPRTRVLAGGAIKVETPGVRLNRVSGREVAIITAPPETDRSEGEYPVRFALTEVPADDK